jgi:hypothetical protein
MPWHDNVRARRQANDVHGHASPLELVELVNENCGIDDAARADHALLAPEDSRGHVLELVRLAVGDDRVAGAGPAVVAADDVRVAREQVDDLALALVTPLRADDHRRRHAGSLPAMSALAGCRRLRVDAREAANPDAVPAPAGHEADVGLRAEPAADDDRRPSPLVVALLALRRERRRGVSKPDDLSLRPLFLLSPCFVCDCSVIAR